MPVIDWLIKSFITGGGKKIKKKMLSRQFWKVNFGRPSTLHTHKVLTSTFQMFGLFSSENCGSSRSQNLGLILLVVFFLGMLGLIPTNTRSPGSLSDGIPPAAPLSPDGRGKSSLF